MKKSIIESHPNVVNEWDYEKNEINPEDISYGSHKKVWWICTNKHSFEQRVDVRTLQNSGCPYCSGRLATIKNNLKTLYPEIASEWDYEKNETLPENYLTQSQKKVWWICNKGHNFTQRIAARIDLNQSCPYCTGQKVGYGNDLKTLYPEIASEWDYEKNIKTPDLIRPGSHKKYWWICSVGHSYDSNCYNRTIGETGCPYCSSNKVGYGNDLKNLYPEIASEWDYEKNIKTPDLILPASNKKYWWICSVGHSFKTTSLARTYGKTGCPYCVLTPRSKEEIYLLFELKKYFKIDEDDHKIKLKRVVDVDIKLPNEKIVIEYDGAYWHKDKVEKDKSKTDALKKSGWIVIRVREKPLKVLSRKFDVSSSTGQYKETANKVLKKLNQLGYEVKDLKKYLEKKYLINSKDAEKYMQKLLKEKDKKRHTKDTQIF